jgi:hypothetical protein
MITPDTLSVLIITWQKEFCIWLTMSISIFVLELRGMEGRVRLDAQRQGWRKMPSNFSKFIHMQNNRTCIWILKEIPNYELVLGLHCFTFKTCIKYFPHHLQVFIVNLLKWYPIHFLSSDKKFKHLLLSNSYRGHMSKLFSFLPSIWLFLLCFWNSVFHGLWLGRAACIYRSWGISLVLSGKGSMNMWLVIINEGLVVEPGSGGHSPWSWRRKTLDLPSCRCGHHVRDHIQCMCKNQHRGERVFIILRLARFLFIHFSVCWDLTLFPTLI